MCEFCNMKISNKGIGYGPNVKLIKTLSETSMDECQIYFSKDKHASLLIWDNLGKASFLNIKYCPICGRKLEVQSMSNLESLIVTFETSENDETVLVVGRANGKNLEAINMFCGESARKIYDMLITVTEND